MHSLNPDHSRNVAWYREEAAGWARRLIAGDSPAAWAQNTETEIRFAIRHLGLQRGDRLLDLGCGWGRHSLPLAAYGVRVTGVDISRELLALARYQSRRQGLSVQWVEADIAHLPLRGAFDAVAQFCGNFLAWFADPDQARAALWEVTALLRPGGRLLIGADDWQPELPDRAQTWDEWTGGAAIYRHRYDPRQRMAHTQTVVFGPGHQRREYVRQTWWPSHLDMERLFAEVGLRVCGRFNDCSAGAFNPARQGLVYVLARQGD